MIWLFFIEPRHESCFIKLTKIEFDVRSLPFDNSAELRRFNDVVKVRPFELKIPLQILNIYVTM